VSHVTLCSGCYTYINSQVDVCHIFAFGKFAQTDNGQNKHTNGHSPQRDDFMNIRVKMGKFYAAYALAGSSVRFSHF
jgi:hypothetical protein